MSCRLRNISQKGRNRLRRSKKVSCKHWGFRHTRARARARAHTHTRDCQGWQHCVVIPLAKHLAGTTGKVEKAKECVVPRQPTEGGRTKVRFFIIICINATQLQVQFIIHFLPVSSGFHSYTHAFRSLLRVFYALRTVPVTSVMSHQHAPHHG